MPGSVLTLGKEERVGLAKGTLRGLREEERVMRKEVRGRVKAGLVKEG